MEAYMTINFHKLLFYRNSVSFMGYTMMNNRLQMDQRKIQPTLDFLTPKCKKSVKIILRKKWIL